MTQIAVTSTLDRFKAHLLYDAKQLRFAAAYTLTKTVKDVHLAVVDRMGVDFDRPTKYTLGAFAVRAATRDNLEAVMFPRAAGGKSTPAQKYLSPTIFGGGRNHRSSELKLMASQYLLPGEFTVPAEGVDLDSYGNFKRQMWNRILSQLQAADGIAGSTQNETERSRKRNRNRVSERYFVPDRFNSSLKPGIYRRTKVGDTWTGAKIEPVVLFTEAPRYQKRFRYFETVDKTIDARLFKHWQDGYDRAIRG